VDITFVENTIQNSTTHDIFVDQQGPINVSIHEQQHDYLYSTTGHVLTWTLSNPSNIEYTIYHNSEPVPGHVNKSLTSGPYVIILSIDNQPIGTHNYTLKSNDSAGGYTFYSILVPVINQFSIDLSPVDISIEVGATNSMLVWKITALDISVPVYIIYDDGIVYETGAWLPGLPLTIGLQDLPIGIHNITLVAFDGYGGKVQDTVFVTVIGGTTFNWYEQPWIWSVIGATSTVAFGFIKLVADKSRKRKKASKEFKVLDWKVLEKLGVARAEDAAVILDLVEREPNSSLTRMRALVENVIEHLYVQAFPKAKDVDKIDLGHKIYDLNQQGIIPAAMHVQLNSLRFIGNLGTHTSEATTKDASATLPMLVNFLEWFIKFEKDIKK